MQRNFRGLIMGRGSTDQGQLLGLLPCLCPLHSQHISAQSRRECFREKLREC